MNTIFVLKEGYPDFEMRGVYSTFELAKREAEANHEFYKLTFLVEEWQVDSYSVPTNMWVLNKENGWQQTLKDFKFNTD